jgi:DeoR family L-fucose operon activator
MKDERHQRILALLVQHDWVATDVLACALAVSQETLRRDLRELQRQGKILRSHGRARSLMAGVSHADPFRTRQKSHHARKADVARRALTWIDEGITLALDASTTSWYLARQLPDLPLTVFTNSLRICQTLERRTHIQLLHSGGWLDRDSACYENPALLALLRHIEIDLFIFSCQGVDAAGDIWDVQGWNARFKQLLLSRAGQSLLLMDGSKRGRTGEVCIGSLSEVTALIDDKNRAP